jgi:hypothetical protein
VVGARDVAGTKAGLMAYLEIETRDGKRRIPLDGERLSIGRLPSNDIVLPYQQISRHHAEMRRLGGVWWIADLQSTNGIWLGDRRVGQHPLGAGEWVELAPGITLTIVTEAIDPDPATLSTLQMPAVAAGARALGAGDVAAGTWTGVRGPVPLPRFGPPLPPSSTANATPPVRAADQHMSTTRPIRGGAQRAEQGAAPSYAELAPDDPLEGDLFRRNRPPTDPPIAGRGARVEPSGAPDGTLLHLCPTCGQLTAADAISCQSCHNSIGQPCRVCKLTLLPIQERCPRCQTLNSVSVRRTGRRHAGG